MEINSFILEEFQELYKLNSEQVNMVVNGFYNFLELHKGNEQYFAMLSDDVDALWHFLLLYYPNYLNIFTKIKVGRVLNHSPNTDSNNDNVEMMVSLTLDKYNQLGLNVPNNALDLRPIDLENSKTDSLVFKEKKKKLDTNSKKQEYVSNQTDLIDDGVDELAVADVVIDSLSQNNSSDSSVVSSSTKSSTTHHSNNHSSSSHLSNCSSSSSHSSSHSNHSSCSSSTSSSSCSSSSCSSSSCSSM